MRWIYVSHVIPVSHYIKTSWHLLFKDQDNNMLIYIYFTYIQYNQYQ